MQLQFSELGEGWARAVLNSIEELDFIRGGQNGILDIESYWIGGSTDAEKNSTLEYSDYYTNDSGNFIILQMNRLKICLLFFQDIQYKIETLDNSHKLL